MNVAQWLNAIDLGQYETLFREHEIDADVLPDLVEADLEKIGVPLGHRKRLMRAIAALSAGGTPPSAAKPASAQPSPSPPTSGAEAERRPITVMFCDLVGSTDLAARLDAEDWRNLVGAYLDEASSAVTGLGGHVLKKLGDGLMALFGYPQAQENDAERGVRAALAIQRALADLNARNARSGAPELSARIGIECGSVVVDACGEVFGEAPNVAARVQVAAEPGTVLVTASVQRQTAGLFVAEDKGAHKLRGVAQPVTLYRIVRASGGGRRGGARALTPLVGREDELALLTRRWSRVLEGEGQFVQVVGEPGIGKSRLVDEFRGKLTETPHTWVEWAASQLLQNTPLHPLAEWGRLRFGGADATDDGRLADLETTLRLIGLDAAEYAPLLAPLVDIPLPPGRAANLPPEELRRRQLAAMTAWVLAGARSQPAVIAFEDLHWADPTSLDLMARLAERGAQSPLLVVATTRPEFRATWAMRSHHGVISLAPLDRAQVRKMVGEIASRHALSDETIDGVGDRTGGVPLFVEEVTRLLLERDAQGGAQAIPPTLQQSLAARLDRLGEAREVAQIGAVLGRDFSYQLLRDVSSTRRRILDDAPAQPAGSAYGSRPPVRRRRPSDRRLPLQARTDPGRRLREPAQEPPSGASPPRGRGVARLERRGRSDRPSFHRGRSRRSRHRMVGQGGRPGAPPLRLPGGDRPSRQGDRHGGQGGRSLRRREFRASCGARPPAQVGRHSRPGGRVVEGIRRGGSKARIRPRRGCDDNGFRRSR